MKRGNLRKKVPCHLPKIHPRFLDYRRDRVHCQGQVWVENAVYILIGITLITIILSLAFPQIEKMEDRGIVKQTISAMNTLDNTIEDAKKEVGNVRIIDFKIAKGRLEINSSSDEIVYILENTKLEMSELNTEIEYGDLILKTEKQGARFKISLKKRYDSLNITFKGEDKLGTLNAGATPYKIVISNLGSPSVNDPMQIDLGLL